MGFRGFQGSGLGFGFEVPKADSLQPPQIAKQRDLEQTQSERKP